MDDSEIEMEEDDTTNDDQEDNAGNEYHSFVTSTPQKKTFECTECENITQCVDCFVRQVNETGYLISDRKKRVHFEEYSKELC